METKQNKSTFTPGPWKVNHNIGHKSELGIIADNAPCIIAIMCNVKAWPVEAEANAQLIAAAPRMFHGIEVALELTKAMADPEHCMNEVIKNASTEQWLQWRTFFETIKVEAEQK